MSFELLVGPPGSGKTQNQLDRALELTAQGKRVWWAGLPNQRADIYRRATSRGSVLGLECQTLQQVYYRLLAHARALKPLVVGTGRLALVGEALAREREALPSPGEARLFAGAIAEAKRYGLTPRDLPEGDPEVERFRAIYFAYESLKGEAWDYDDFRREALRLAERGDAVPEAQALLVDGFRELSPLDLRLLSALARQCEVRLALPQTPAGYEPTLVLESAGSTKHSVYQAANPVNEARWILSSLKRDLACGFDPLDLAVILPEGESVAFAALADEYGVPVMDERPMALTDSRAGRLLLELLELPGYPTASRLLPIRELAPLANAALEAGVAGYRAFTQLAEQIGVADSWRHWLKRLTLPEEAPSETVDAWAANLVDLALSLAYTQVRESPQLLPEGGQERVLPDRERVLPEGGQERMLGDKVNRPANFIPPELFRKQALLRAKEASRVAAGAGFGGWWAALLGDANVSMPQRGGVALLDERQVSGRRFRKAYLKHATEGTYGTGEREDYFVPEEQRTPLARLLEGQAMALPRRFEGRDSLLFAELRAVADELIVTFPSGDQGGPMLAEPELLGGVEPQPLPLLAAGSRLELSAFEGYRPVMASTNLGNDEPVSLEELRRYDECGMRYWLQELLGSRHGLSGETGGWWRPLFRELEKESRHDAEHLDSLAERFPQASEWLASHRELFLGLRFGVVLPFEGAGLQERVDDPNEGGASLEPVNGTSQPEQVTAEVRLDAAVTLDREAIIYTFAGPGSIADREAAQEFLEARWSELWAAGHMLRRYPGRIRKVRLLVWPVLGEPVEAYPGGIRSQWRRIGFRTERARAALERISSGSVSPSPGFRCGSCPVRDVCRDGAL